MFPFSPFRIPPPKPFTPEKTILGLKEQIAYWERVAAAAWGDGDRIHSNQAREKVLNFTRQLRELECR